MRAVLRPASLVLRPTTVWRSSRHYGCTVIWAVRNLEKAQKALDKLDSGEGTHTCEDGHVHRSDLPGTGPYASRAHERASLPGSNSHIDTGTTLTETTSLVPRCCGKTTGKAILLQVDISDLTTVKPFVTDFLKLGLPLHYLILNAVRPPAW